MQTCLSIVVSFILSSFLVCISVRILSEQQYIERSDMELNSEMNDVKKDVFSDIVCRQFAEVHQIRRNSAPPSMFLNRGEEMRNTNESQENNRQTLVLCGKILRTMGDEQTSKAFGKHLRKMGDAMYSKYTVGQILAQVEHERRDMNQNMDIPTTLVDRRPSSR